MYDLNCKKLIEILDKNNHDEKVMIAELFRNLGNFAACDSILETITEEKHNWIKIQLKEECKKNNKDVIELRQ
jgi:hypothetical protein